MPKISADNDPGMPLMSHLLELRNRLLRIIGLVLLIFLGLIYFANDLYGILAQPIRDILPDDVPMIATEVTSTFFAPFKLTLWVAFFVAMPYVLTQAWQFVSPGLYDNEKRIALPLITSSILLFYCGMAFAYFVVLPLMLNFFAQVTPDAVQLTPDINQYLTIALKLFFAFGLAFQVPVATFLLMWSGVLSPKELKEKRPYVIVGCFLFGMLLTPPDAISQTLLAVPMWLLFEVGVLFGRWVPRRPEDIKKNGHDSDKNAEKAI